MFLERMNYPDVEAYLKRKDTVVIPVGSLENHGKHMPLGTDSLIPARICELLDARSPDVVIAPTLPYGATEDLRGFPGTVSLGAEGLRTVMESICGQLFDCGFRRFIIMNGHGGNNKPLELVGLNLYRRGAYMAIVNWWLIAGQLNPAWKGGHGGAEEAAGVMAVDPDLIRPEYLTLGEGIRNDVSDELPSGSWTAVDFHGASVTVPRPVTSITDNGWLAHGMGSDEPAKATREWGEKMLDAMADYVKDFIGALERARLPVADR